MDDKPGFKVPVNQEVFPSTSAPVTQPPEQPPVKIKSAHNFIFGYIVLILLVVAGGLVYSWQHGKVKTLSTQVNSLNSQVSSLKSQAQSSSTSAQTSSSNVSISYPLALTKQEMLTTLYLPSGYNVLQVDPGLSSPQDESAYYTDSENDIVANWDFNNTGTSQNPSQLAEGLANITITSTNKWSTTADPSGVSYASNTVPGSSTGSMTAAQKATFIANLKSQTATCIKSSSDGFVTSDGNYNICYTLENPQAEGGDYVLNISGYGDISDSVNYLRGYIDLPNATHQTAEASFISSLKELKTTVKATT